MLDALCCYTLQHRLQLITNAVTTNSFHPTGALMSVLSHYQTGTRLAKSFFFYKPAI